MINTHEEYMRELRRSLEDFDPDFSSEILEDFEAHFTEGLENGMTEEEICRELGPVENVIAELREDFRSSSPNVPKVTTIRPGDKAGSSRETPVSQIHIRLINASVRLSSADVPDVICDYDKNDFDERFVMYTEGGTLFLREKPLPFFRRLMSVNVNGCFTFAVPPCVETVDISDTNSRIQVSDLSLRSIRLSDVNGRIAAEQITADNCEFYCVNGQIRFEKCTAQSLKASTVNGGVTGSGCFGALDLHSTNGSLHADAEVKKELSLGTVNGSVSARYKKAENGADIDLTSNWGAISASFNNTNMNGKKNLRTAYGDKELKICIHTQNGKIRLQEVSDTTGQQR